MKKKQHVALAASVAPMKSSSPVYDATIEEIDSHLDFKSNTIQIRSELKWYTRLWYVISNPFCYIFKGYIRY